MPKKKFRSVWLVFRWPLLISIMAIIGLIIGLLDYWIIGLLDYWIIGLLDYWIIGLMGDGLVDVMSWILLGSLLVIMLFSFINSTD